MDNREYLKNIASSTKKYCNDVVRAYGKKVYDVTIYENLKSVPEIVNKEIYTTWVKVFNQDTIDCAYDVISRGYNPLILNMASDYFPGGGWLKGSMAQEEELFRRSTYYLSLDPRHYPLSNTCGLYSPTVTVFRGGYDDDYTLYQWDECQSMSFVAVPAIRNPDVIKGMLNEGDEEITLNKIRLVFKIAKANGHDSLVLGALGCGAYNNPPEHIAMLFKRVINEYKGQFKYITFAILSNKGNPNFDIFKETLYG